MFKPTVPKEYYNDMTGPNPSSGADDKKRRGRFTRFLENKREKDREEDGRPPISTSTTNTTNTDSAYESSGHPTRKHSPDFVAVGKHDLPGVASDRHLWMDRNNGEIFDEESGDVITTVTTTTTTTTTTTSRGGRKQEVVDVKTVQGEPQAVNPSNRGTTLGTLPAREAGGLNEMPAGATTPGLGHGGMLGAPSHVSGSTAHDTTTYPTSHLGVGGLPTRSDPSPPVPGRHPDRISGEHSRHDVSDYERGHGSTATGPVSPVTPTKHNFSYPTRSGAPGTTDEAPVKRSGSTFANLKAAAVAAHGIGETLRGTLNEAVDSRYPRHNATKASAANEKNQAAIDRGRAEMERLNLGRSHGREQNVGTSHTGITPTTTHTSGVQTAGTNTSTHVPGTHHTGTHPSDNITSSTSHNITRPGDNYGSGTHQTNTYTGDNVTSGTSQTTTRPGDNITGGSHHTGTGIGTGGILHGGSHHNSNTYTGDNVTSGTSHNTTRPGDNLGSGIHNITHSGSNHSSGPSQNVPRPGDNYNSGTNYTGGNNINTGTSHNITRPGDDYNYNSATNYSSTNTGDNYSGGGGLAHAMSRQGDKTTGGTYNTSSNYQDDNTSGIHHGNTYSSGNPISSSHNTGLGSGTHNSGSHNTGLGSLTSNPTGSHNTSTYQGDNIGSGLHHNNTHSSGGNPISSTYDSGLGSGTHNTGLGSGTHNTGLGSGTHNTSLGSGTHNTGLGSSLGSHPTGTHHHSGIGESTSRPTGGETSTNPTYHAPTGTAVGSNYGTSNQTSGEKSSGLGKLFKRKPVSEKPENQGQPAKYY